MRALLFDLDGTLADTAPDLAAALNHTREIHNLAPLSYEAIRPHVSNGAAALIAFGFDFEEGDPKAEVAREALVEYYQHNLCNKTKLFPGMEKVIDYLDQYKMPWGIVTNKPSYLTDPLCEALKLNTRAKSIVSGDTASYPKPHPAPLLYASKELQINPAHTLYVGDALRDIVAGKNAGMKTAVALFGYINDEDMPANWNADYMLNNAEELIPMISATAKATH